MLFVFPFVPAVIGPLFVDVFNFRTVPHPSACTSPMVLPGLYRPMNTRATFSYAGKRTFLATRKRDSPHRSPKHSISPRALIEDDGEGEEESEMGYSDYDPMDPKRTLADVKNFLTYRAVKVVLEQLSETNLQLHRWFHNFSVSNKTLDGDDFLIALLSAPEDKVKNPYSGHVYNIKPLDVAQRVMAVRRHLASQLGSVHQAVTDSNLNILRRHLSASLKDSGDKEEADS